MKKKKFRIGLPEGVTIDDLINRYKDLQSAVKVSKEFGISGSTAERHLRKAGVLNKAIRYTCNDNYFSTNTPESFYWAGFIAADGCVILKDKKYKILSIGLAIKDLCHLEKFKKAIGFNGPIARNPGKYESCMTRISSNKIFDDLARFNIVPRKSLIYTFPEWLIDHPLVNHFMRGYNDGDGCFTVRKKTKTVQLSISLSGTKKFLKAFSNVLNINCGFDDNKILTFSDGIYMFGYSGNRKVSKIRDFLYKGSTKETRLDRKYDIAFDDCFANMPENCKSKPVIGTNIITGVEINLKSMKSGRELGFSPSNISVCCSGKLKTHKGYAWKYAIV